MKNIKFMFAIGLMLSFLVSSAFCNDMNSTKRARAEEMVDLFKLDEVLKSQEQTFINIMIQKFPKLAGHEKELGKIFRDGIPADINDFTINLYVTNFSEEELNEMIKFYQSPTGKSVLKKLPVIMQQTVVYTQQSIDGTKIQEGIEALYAKIDTQEAKNSY